MKGFCRMSRSLPRKYKEKGKDITGRQKNMKGKPSETCLRVNSVNSHLWTPEGASLFRSRNSALLEKQSRKIGKKKAGSSYANEVDGMTRACLLRVRGRAAQEGRGVGVGGEGSPPLEAGWGCVQARDPAAASARGPARRGVGLPKSGLVGYRVLGSGHSGFHFQYGWVAGGPLVLSGAWPPPPGFR